MISEWFSELKYRVRLLFKRRQLEKDLQDEMDFHIAMREARLRETANVDAHEVARQQFGNLANVKDDCRHVWTFATLERFLLDLRYATRSLLKAPTFSVIAVLSLAIGIGATTGIFTLFDHFLLTTLPVEEPSRLVNLSSPGPESGSHSCSTAGDCDTVFSYPMFRDLEHVQNVFTGIAAHSAFGANLNHQNETISGQGSLVSGNYFSVLGVKSALGRLLGPEDDGAPGQSSVAIVSYSYWKTHLGAAPSALNDTIYINGHPLTVVGVTPEGFEGTTLGHRPDVYVPITLSRTLISDFFEFNDRTSHWIYLFARLRPGVSREQARATINIPYRAILNDVEASLQSDVSAATLERFKARQLVLEAGEHGQSKVRTQLEAPLTLLLGVTGLVLLIACANIANLMLARSVSRQGEMAIRLSIGASRRQVVAHVLTEAFLLAAIGAAGGLLAARWTMDLLILTDPAEAASLPHSLDWSVLAFAAVVTIGTTFLFGLLPAIYSARISPLAGLKRTADRFTGSSSAARFRSGIATLQIAVSLILLVAAGLFARSLYNVTKVEVGVNTDKLIVFGLSPAQNGYSPLRSAELFVQVEDELRRQAGISAVTASELPLLGGNRRVRAMAVEGFDGGADADIRSNYNAVGPGYFAALGVPLLAGREFSESDTTGRPAVAVVNQQFVEKFHLGNNPIGKHIGTDGRHSELNVEVVGIVKDSKYSGLKESTPPIVFRPYRQDPLVGSMTFYVRGATDVAKVLAAIQPTIARIDRTLPVENLETMDEQRSRNMGKDQVLSTLSASFAILATLLAAVGLYGVLAYTVVQRTREFAIRIALGARPLEVQTLILRQLGRMLSVGVTTGIAGAILLGHAAQSLLFELKGYDPLALVIATLLLGLIAVTAGLIPARRAAKVDPIRALRCE